MQSDGTVATTTIITTTAAAIAEHISVHEKKTSTVNMRKELTGDWRLVSASGSAYCAKPQPDETTLQHDK